MSVAMLIDNPTGSQETYEQLRSKLGLDGPIGGAVHIAGVSPKGGWRVIEIFDSVEAAGTFLRERFGPALAELGFAGPPPEPEFWPVHNLMTAETADVG